MADSKRGRAAADDSTADQLDSSLDGSGTGDVRDADPTDPAPEDSTRTEQDDVPKVTGSPIRRPNPAASAASRARRIGGATGTPRAGASTADRASATDTGAGVSMRKRQPRTTATSARELKAAASGASNTVTEVPDWLRWAPAVVLSLCALAMIVIIAVAAHGVWYATPSTDTARDKVLAAAKRCTAVANTYNYKTLAADEKRGLACTTGAWTAQYKSALEKIVKPTATQLKASQTVQINSAGVESVAGGGKQWTTIVYGQLTINQSGATPRIDQFAAIVRMDKVRSTYLVSKIDLVTNPTA